MPSPLITEEKIPVCRWIVYFVTIMLLGIPVHYVSYKIGLISKITYGYVGFYTVTTLFVSLYFAKMDA